jgi:hypothetical protein
MRCYTQREQALSQEFEAAKPTRFSCEVKAREEDVHIRSDAQHVTYLPSMSESAILRQPGGGKSESWKSRLSPPQFLLGP